MIKKILLIGGGGFLGSEIRKQLGSEMQVFYTSRNPNDDLGIKMSLEDDQEFEDGDFDAVVYNAAHLPRPQNAKAEICHKINYESMIRAFEAYKFSSGKFIYISTTAIFESNSGLISETTMPEAKCDYSLSKKNAEDFLMSREYGSSVGIIRPGTIYGNSMNSDRILPFMVQQAKSSIDFDVINPNVLLHVVHVDDVVFAIRRMIDSSNVVCVNSVTETMSKLELAHLVKARYGIVKSFDEASYDRRSEFDNRKFLDLLDRKPRFMKEYLYE